MRRIILGTVLLILATLFFIPRPVLATPQLTLDGRVIAQARVPSGNNVDSDANHLTAGPTVGSVSDARTAHAVGNLGGTADTLADAMFDGTATFGLLRGMASAEAIGGTAFVQVTLRWDDDFTATSNILPFGSPVDYQFTISLDSAISINFPCGGPAGAIASLVGNNGAAGIISHRACGPSDGASALTVIHTTVGARLPLSGEMSLSASVGSSPSSRPHNIATVNAIDTGKFFVDPVGPNYSYRTASGVTYFSPSAPPGPNPIPEPSTLSLVALGMTVLGARRLRERLAHRRLF
jgi:hypothetical protein